MCVDPIKIKFGDFVCETESDPQAALGFSSSGCSCPAFEVPDIKVIDGFTQLHGEERKKPEREPTYRSLQRPGETR